MAPKPALIKWSARMVAEWVMARADRMPDLLADLGRDELLSTLLAAPETARRKATVRGTTLHRHAESLIRGEPIDLNTDVPEEAEQLLLVESLARFLDRWGAEDVLVEASVFNRKLHYGGTLDVVADLKRDGRRWLLDYTTGDNVYGEKALQVAGYAHCEFYIGEKGQEHPMPELDALGVIRVSADGAYLHPLVDPERAWRLFCSLLPIYHWQREEDAAYYGRGLPPLIAAPLVDP